MSLNVEEQNITIDELISQYVETNKPCVHILTPCYGGTCYVNYMICLMNTQNIFSHYKIEYKIHFMQQDSLISRARNNLIAHAMSDPTMTHVMFIDNDITWDPIEIIKLLLSDKPVVGGIYPLKRYDWTKIIPTEQNPNPVQTILDRKNNSSFASNIPNSKYIQNKLLQYNVNYISDKIQINKNLTQVKHIATGFMMIKRDVIDKMFLAYSHTKYTDDINALTSEQNKFAYALFDTEVVDDHYYSEDWLFCHRWTQINGELWIDISIALTHTGVEHYSGNYMASLL